jgi:hypothetical protein
MYHGEYINRWHRHRFLASCNVLIKSFLSQVIYFAKPNVFGTVAKYVRRFDFDYVVKWHRILLKLINLLAFMAHSHYELILLCLASPKETQIYCNLKMSNRIHIQSTIIHAHIYHPIACLWYRINLVSVISNLSLHWHIGNRWLSVSPRFFCCCLLSYKHWRLVLGKMTFDLSWNSCL